MREGDASTEATEAEEDAEEEVESPELRPSTASCWEMVKVAVVSSRRLPDMSSRRFKPLVRAADGECSLLLEGNGSNGSNGSNGECRRLLEAMLSVTVHVASSAQREVWSAAASSSAVREGGMVAVSEDCWKRVTEALVAVVAARLEVSSARVRLRPKLAFAES